MKYLPIVFLGLLALNGLPIFGQNLSMQSPLKKKVSGGVDTVHYLGMQQNTDPVTVISPALAFKLSNRTKWTLVQTFSKLYTVDPGQKEVQASDTLVKYSHNFWKNILTLDWYVMGEFTLPVSEFSRNNDVFTKPAAAIKVTKTFADEKVLLSLAPFYRYFVNEYTTTSTDLGDHGGLPLRLQEYGASFGAEYSPIDYLTFSAAVRYAEVFYEKLGRQNRQSINAEKLVFGHNYSFDISASVQLSQRYQISAGFSQADQVERSGGMQMVAYDPVSTQVYGGLHYSF